MAEFTLAPCVEDELWEIWDFIVQDNPSAATSVVEAAFDTFKTLAGAPRPRLGRRRKFRNPRLKEVRSWRVSGFDNYLIFYRPNVDGIEVLHVFHGARDIETLLGDK